MHSGEGAYVQFLSWKYIENHEFESSEVSLLFWAKTTHLPQNKGANVLFGVHTPINNVSGCTHLVEVLLDCLPIKTLYFCGKIIVNLAFIGIS